MIVSSSSRNDASSSSAPAGVGINYEWHRCCSCFETLLVKNEDRHSRPRTMHKLWDEFSGGTLGSQPLFELFRLILPHLDTVRPQYRLKQKGLANMYVSILAISGFVWRIALPFSCGWTTTRYWAAVARVGSSVPRML